MDKDNNRLPTDERIPPSDVSPVPVEGVGVSPEQSVPNPGNETAVGPRPKRKAPIGVIVLAVIVASVLAAVAIFAYRQANAPAPYQLPEPTGGTVSGAEVGAAANEIGNIINEFNETVDFAENELSNQTLGL